MNVQCLPSPLIWVTSGTPVLVQADEAGQVQADDAGNVLTPDAPILTTLGDENNHPLTDENGNLSLPEPGPGP